MNAAQAIAKCISREAEFYASGSVKDTVYFQSPRRFSHIGRTVPELDDEYIREWFVYSY